MNYLKDNLLEINKRIDEAAKRVGRNREDITLIAVSKTVEADIMNASIDAGVTDLGENRVQEIQRKYDDVKKGVKWHLIGHLQRNKVKYIINKVDLIHSVDSFRLAKEISERALKADKIMDILVQVDIAKEDSKFGVDESKVEDLIREILTLSNIKVKGLMFIAPFVDDPEEVRVYFRGMKSLFDRIKETIEDDKLEMEHLSMGMTNDFEVAIEEGATLLRVGTGIYGKRSYL